jgi:hypothetical protein
MGLVLGLLMLASGVAKVTPGNVGIEQGAAMWGAHLMGVEATLGLLASALFRVCAAAVVFSVGPVMTNWIEGRLGRGRRTVGVTEDVARVGVG